MNELAVYLDRYYEEKDMKAWELTEDEIADVLRNSLVPVHIYTYAESVARVAGKAAQRNLMKWLEGLCKEHESPGFSYPDRRDCPQCWQQLKEDLKK